MAVKVVVWPQVVAIPQLVHREWRGSRLKSSQMRHARMAVKVVAAPQKVAMVQVMRRRRRWSKRRRSQMPQALMAGKVVAAQMAVADTQKFMAVQAKQRPLVFRHAVPRRGKFVVAPQVHMVVLSVAAPQV